MRVRRVSQTDEHAIEELLDQDRLVNLFLLGFLAAVPMDESLWYAAFEGDIATGAALIVPRRLLVPFAPEGHAADALGELLRAHHAPCMMVGPRAACDRIWSRWARDVAPFRRIDQRLYACEERPDGGGEPVRRARSLDVPVLTDFARQMQIEDLGQDPAALDPERHAREVRERVDRGRTWVMEHEGEVSFVVSVGTITSAGCQLGGTFVPRHLRGRGIATQGMRAVTRHLLDHHAAVTLHVNEANAPAVRCYERVGYRRRAPYRIITVDEAPPEGYPAPSGHRRHGASS